MANEIVYKIIADTRQYVNAMKPAIKTGGQLEETNEDLEKAGIKTSAAFRKELIALEKLTREYKNDKLATAQLTQKKRELIGQMKRLETQTVGGTKAVGGMKAGVIGMRGAWQAMLATGVVAFLVDITRAGIDTQRAISIMQNSVSSANREFGENVGTMEEWAEVNKVLQKQFGLSEAAVNRASARTVTMTKRLGLNAAQMRVVLERSAALSIGMDTLEGGVERVSAALRGEAEASEALGLTLNQNFIKQQALARGLDKDLIAKLNEAELAQLRFLEVMEQSNAAFANVDVVMSTQAAKLDRLISRWQNMRGELGSTFLVMIEGLGVFDVAEGKINLLEFALRASAVATGKLTPELATLLAQAGEGAETIDKLGREFEQFARDISAVSETIAASITEDAFRAADEAGTLLEFRKEIFDRAAADLIDGIRKEAQARQDVGAAAKTIRSQQVVAVKKLQTALAELSGPEGARIALLDIQLARLKEQLTVRRNLARQAGLQAEADAFLSSVGLGGPTKIGIRGQDELDDPTRFTRTIQARGPDGIIFIKENLSIMEDGKVKLKELSSEYEAWVETTKVGADEIARALADPFDRAGIAFDFWLFNTQQGLTFLAESVGDVAADISGAFGTLFNQLVSDQTDALVRSGLSVADARKKATKDNLIFFRLNQGIAAAGAFADTFAAANKALASGPPPFNYVAMAGVIATGLANVTKILGASPGGGAGGGAGSTAPPASTPGTSSFTPTQPGGILAGNAITFDPAQQNAQLQTAIAAGNEAVVAAINDLEITTELMDDHQLIAVKRAQGLEADVGVGT